MRAEEARELFSAAYDEELTEAERGHFEEALADDPELRAEYDDFCTFLKGTSALASDEHMIPQVDLLAAVQRKISERTRGRYYRNRRPHKMQDQLMTLLIIALIMIFLGVTVWMGVSFIDDQPPPSEENPQGEPAQADPAGDTPVTDSLGAE